MQLKSSDFVKEHDPAYKDFDNTGSDVPGTNFYAYKNLLVSMDVFALKNSDPLFLVICNEPNPRITPYFPHCSVRERIWDGNVLLEYRYERAIIEGNLESSIDIDTKLHALLTSFRTSTPSDGQTNSAGNCQ
ncbi:MAG: hypothetical protein ABSG46_08690 [Candidatus Binataceae bacterium]